jgi:hypothetical protein
MAGNIAHESQSRSLLLPQVKCQVREQQKEANQTNSADAPADSLRSPIYSKYVTIYSRMDIEYIIQYDTSSKLITVDAGT